VHIASTADEFIKGINAALDEDADRRRGRVREFLSKMSWDKTYLEMRAAIDAATDLKAAHAPQAAAG